jgi:hypothetical protein
MGRQDDPEYLRQQLDFKDTEIAALKQVQAPPDGPEAGPGWRMLRRARGAGQVSRKSQAEQAETAQLRADLEGARRALSRERRRSGAAYERAPAGVQPRAGSAGVVGSAGMGWAAVAARVAVLVPDHKSSVPDAVLAAGKTGKASATPPCPPHSCRGPSPAPPPPEEDASTLRERRARGALTPAASPGGVRARGHAPLGQPPARLGLPARVRRARRGARRGVAPRRAVARVLLGSHLPRAPRGAPKDDAPKDVRLGEGFRRREG